jgi:cytoskeleton protein RodZ
MSEQEPSFEPSRDGADISIGALLRQAREARGMSVETVGHAIKLAPRQVEAIEADAFDRLMNPTYARGFIRNYAALIGLDAQALLARLDQQHVRATPQLIEQTNVGVTMPTQSVRRKWLLPVLALSVPALAALALYVWFEFWPAAAPAYELPALDGGAAAVAGPQQEAPAFALPEADPLPPPSSVEPGVPDTVAVPGEVPPAEAVAPVASAPGQRQLQFSFKADSWLELRGDDGEIIISELNRAGSSRTIAAKFPVSLIIGNARSVAMNVDGEPYDLAPAIKVDVARLRLE